MSNDATQLADEIQPVDQISPTSKQLEDWVVNIKTRLGNQFSDLTKSSQHSTDINSEEKKNNEQKPSIFCHSPRLVYFGGVSSKNTAWKFVAFLTQWFGLNLRSYIEDIQKKEDVVLGYYVGLDGYYCGNREFFLEYLLINSCILLFAFLSFQNVWNTIGIMSGTKERRIDAGDQRSREFYNLHQYISKFPMFFKSEMLFMDCQIPWFVVEAVYTKHFDLRKLVGIPIDKLALSCFDDLYPRVHKSKVRGGTGTLPHGGIKHLLHLFHWSRTPEGKYLMETRSSQPIKKMDSFHIPGATDLKLSATVFKKRTGIHVSYRDKRLSGVMQLAPFHIFDHNYEIYCSLLKFEQGYIDCGFPVTAYVACMMKLLQTEADARLLRANGIVPGTGNDEKGVLRFVQRFKTVLSDDVRMPNDLNILSEKVRTHHQRSSSISYAEFKRRYFGNLWITISVIAGMLLFVLTFIQTLYSTLSYYKQ